MATSNSRNVKLGIEIETKGEEGLTDLAKQVRALAREGGPAEAAFLGSAAALDKFAAATRQATAAEAAARSETNAAKSAQSARREELERLKATSDRATRGTVEYQQAETSLRVAIVDGNAALRAQKEALTQATAARKSAAAAERSLRDEVTATVAAYKQAGAAAKESGDAARKSIDGIAAGFNRLGVAAAAALSGREFVQTLADSESLGRGLVAVTGSASAAAAELAFLKRTSNELGLETLSAGKAYLSLSAATQGTVLEGEKTREVFTAIARAMSTLGKSSAETENALRAVAQMASKGTVSMEELRGQLGEALPGALKAAADGAGVTTQQLISMVESGNVLASELLPALTKGLNNLYASGGPPETMLANWNRLKNTITETAVALGEGGVGKALTTTAGAAAVAVLAVGESFVNVGADLGEFAGAIRTGNFELSTQATRLAESEAKIKALGTTAGLSATDVAVIGTAAEEAGRKARDAFNRFERAAQNAADGTGKVVLGVIDLSAKFETLRAKGDTAAEAIAKIGKDFDLGTAIGITSAEDVLNRLVISGRLTAQEFRDAWRDALKGVDLAEFEARARGAFTGASGEARKLKTVLDSIADESLRRAGTSLDELTTGFSKASARAIGDVDALTRTLADLKITGDEAGRAISKSLDIALAAATTEKSVQAVIDRFEALGKSGQLAGQQLADGLEKAKQKLDDLRPGIQSLDEALRSFGLRTQTELQATADKLGASYQRIAYDARVSLADQRKAFEAYSAAAIAANGGVESSAVQVARVVLETREAALGAGKAGAEAGRATAAGFDAATASINAAAGSLDSFSAAATKARNAASLSTLGGNTYDKNGFAQDSNGNKLELSGQAVVGDDEYFDKAAYDREVFQTAGSGRPRFVDPQRFVKKKTGNAAPGRSQGGSGSAAPGLTLSGSGTPSGSSPFNTATPSAAPAPGIVSKGGAAAGSYTVNVNIAGRATAIQVASRPDADNLAGVLRQLGESALRANP